MLSIIICSRNKTLSKELVNNITNTVGLDYEIIPIDNSENKYSIFEAYNEGFSKSNYPYICFVHEDVLFHTQNWGKKVIVHLQDPKTGIIGLAGGDLVTRIPASWSNLISVSKNIIQSDRSGNRKTEIFQDPENYNNTKRSAILLDGVFLCMKRELMTEIQFDETLRGFHGYDYDITMQSTIAGYINYVIYDVELEHFSRGKTDTNYYRNLIVIFKKWEKHLPLIGRNITDLQRLEIPEIEKENLLRLIKKMVRKGFETKEIISEANFYAEIINAKKIILFLQFRIFLIRLFNRPKYLFKKKTN